MGLQPHNYKRVPLYIMALLKLAGVWERFILKDLTTFAKYAKVELVPPGPGDLVGAVKGVGKLTGDALTFKWAQASMKQVAVNTIVVTEIACWFFIGGALARAVWLATTSNISSE